MKQERIHERTVLPRQYSGYAGGGHTLATQRESDRRRLNAAQDGWVKRQTGGLVRFDGFGNVVLAVDPSKVKEIES